MKPGKLCSMLLALLIVAGATLFALPEGKKSPNKHAVTLLSSPAIQEMANLWVREYAGTHPDADIRVIPISGVEPEELRKQQGSIALAAKGELSGICSDQSRIMVIGRDVIVPVMNSGHPDMDQILQRGISPEEFSGLFASAGTITWGTLLGNGSVKTVVPLVDVRSGVERYLADFLQTDPDQIKGTRVAGMDEMIEVLRNNLYAIGFCRLTQVMSPEGEAFVPGLSVVPIDRNGNAAIDPLEDIYRTPASLQRGIWIGKYPKALYGNFYLVSDGQPLGTGEIAFLDWLVSEGQELLTANGYVAITHGERYAMAEKLTGNQGVIADVPLAGSASKNTLFVLGSLIVLVFLILLIFRITRNRQMAAGSLLSKMPQDRDGNLAEVPGGLFFDKSHTWVFMEKDGKVRVGIDDFLQQMTGPITRVIMKNPGEQVRKGEAFLTLVQHGKQLKIQSPVSGVVAEHNGGLTRDSSLINSGPFAEGWVYMVERVDWLRELKAFAMGERYTEWINTEIQRLKDFLASGISLPGRVQPLTVLQDGGEPEKGFLEALGPEAWEEFQSGFLNRSSIK